MLKRCLSFKVGFTNSISMEPEWINRQMWWQDKVIFFEDKISKNKHYYKIFRQYHVMFSTQPYNFCWYMLHSIMFRFLHFIYHLPHEICLYIFIYCSRLVSVITISGRLLHKFKVFRFTLISVRKPIW